MFNRIQIIRESIIQTVHKLTLVSILTCRASKCVPNIFILAGALPFFSISFPTSIPGKPLALKMNCCHISTMAASCFNHQGEVKRLDKGWTSLKRPWPYGQSTCFQSEPAGFEPSNVQMFSSRAPRGIKVVGKINTSHSICGFLGKVLEKRVPQISFSK